MTSGSEPKGWLWGYLSVRCQGDGLLAVLPLLTGASVCVSPCPELPALMAELHSCVRAIAFILQLWGVQGVPWGEGTGAGSAGEPGA